MLRPADNIFFAGRKKEISPEALAMRQRDEQAQAKRGAMPISLQMLAPILPNQIGAKQMGRIQDRFSWGAAVRQEPALQAAVAEMSPDVEGHENLQALREHEKAFLGSLGHITDLFMADISGTKGLPETISAIENTQLRNHLKKEYLYHFYNESDEKLAKAIGSIEGADLQGEWKEMFLASSDPRFLRLNVAMLIDAIKDANLMGDDSLPIELEDGKKGNLLKKDLKNAIVIGLLKNYLERATHTSDRKTLTAVANSLISLPDADLKQLLPSINDNFLKDLGTLSRPIEMDKLSVSEFRYNTLLGLIMDKEAPVRVGAIEHLPLLTDEAMRQDLIQLIMHDADDTCHAMLLTLQLPQDEPQADKTAKQKSGKKVEAKEVETPPDEYDANKHPLLTPEQYDEIMLDLSSRPTKSPYYDPLWSYKMVACYIGKASSEEHILKIASNLLTINLRESVQTHQWLWQNIYFMKDDEKKAQLIKHFAEDADSENVGDIAWVIASIKDEKCLSDVVSYLDANNCQDIWAIGMDCRARDKKSIPADVMTRIRKLCQEAISDDNKGKKSLYNVFSVLRALPDSKERLNIIRHLSRSKNAGVRSFSASTAWRVEPMSARIELVERLFNDKDPKVARAAVGMFYSLPLKERIRLSRQVLNSGDAEMRHELFSVKGLMPWMNKHNQKAYFERLSRPDGLVETRLTLAKNLSKIRNKDLQAELAKRLAKDPDPKVRQTVLRGLSDISDLETQKELAEHYSQYPDYENREGMLQAVRKASVPDLNAMLADYPQGNIDLLLKSFKIDPAKVTRDRWIGLVHAMPTLQLMGTLDIEAGQLQKSIIPQFYKVMEHGKSLVNMHNDPEDPVTDPERVETTFREYRPEILSAITLLGAEPLRHKLSLTLDPFMHLLYAVMKLPKDERLLKPLYALAHMPGVKATDVTKMVEMTTGLCVINQSEKAIEQLQQMADRKNLDIPTLSKTYLREFFRQYDPQHVPDERQLDTWDLNMVHNLYYIQDQISKRDRVDLVQQLMTALNTNSLDEFLTSKQNGTGSQNASTAYTFKKLGLNMNTWLHYNEEHRFSTLKEDDLKVREEMVPVLFDEFSQLMNSLMGSRQQEIAGLLDQQSTQGLFTALKKSRLPFGFENGQFVFKGEGQITVQDLSNIATEVESFLNGRNLFKRAAKAGDEKMLQVQTQLESLKGMLDECQVTTKPCVNYSFKIWDRNPRTGIFMGNYGTNCVAADGFNNAEIVTFITNHSFQMLEIHDDAVNEPVGVAFLYWMIDDNGKLALAVDSIDVSKKYLRQTDTALIRKNVVPYLQKYATAVSGRSDVPILMGKHYNDVPSKDLDKIRGKFRFVGGTQTGKAYVELLGGHRSVNKPHHTEAFVLAS